MAFYGYSVTRSNIYNASTRDVMPRTYDIEKAYTYIDAFKSDNNIGDVILVFEEDTEYDSTLVFSTFNDPCDGWIIDYKNTINYQC